MASADVQGEEKARKSRQCGLNLTPLERGFLPCLWVSQCWDLPGAAEAPPSSLGAALGLLQLVLGAGGKLRGARGGRGNIALKGRAFRLGQGGSKGRVKG